MDYENDEVLKAIKEINEEIEKELKSKLRRLKWDQIMDEIVIIDYTYRPRIIPIRLGIKKDDNRTVPIPSYLYYDEEQEMSDEELMMRLKNNIREYSELKED